MRRYLDRATGVLMVLSIVCGVCWFIWNDVSFVDDGNLSLQAKLIGLAFLTCAFVGHLIGRKICCARREYMRGYCDALMPRFATRGGNGRSFSPCEGCSHLQPICAACLAAQDSCSAPRDPNTLSPAAETPEKS
jgi:hypothetical protein